MRYIFIGAAGVGKGTFAKLICDAQKLHHFSLGDKMRKEVESKSELGNIISSYLKSGRLVPDELANRVVIETLNKFDEKNEGFILDGYPRTLTQAQFLEDNYTSKKNHKILAVNITLNDDVTVQKLLGRRFCSTCGGSFNVAHIVEGHYDMPAILPNSKTCKLGDRCDIQLIKRDDDTPEVIATRQKEFQKNIQPLLHFYQNKNLLLNFQVYKGIKDTNELYRQMSTFSLPR